MRDVRQDRIARFNSRHDVSEDQQFKQLIEEVGELSEAYNTEAGDRAVAEELADVIFVARSLAEIREINMTAVVNEVIAENSEKDESTAGQKVTKSGLDDDSEQSETDYGVTD